jgi:hypothetical protein
LDVEIDLGIVSFFDAFQWYEEETVGWFSPSGSENVNLVHNAPRVEGFRIAEFIKESFITGELKGKEGE